MIPGLQTNTIKRFHLKRKAMDIYPCSSSFYQETIFQQTDNGENTVKFQPIHLMSPFLSRPLYSDAWYRPIEHVRHEIWLDSNLLSQAKAAVRNPNLESLIWWGTMRNIKFSIAHATLEKLRTSSVSDANDMLFKSAIALNELYDINIDPEQLVQANLQFLPYLAEQQKYIDRLAYYIVLIRSGFMHKAGCARKCKSFVQYIAANLPKLIIPFFLGCLYFFVKDNRTKYQSFGKLQSDMNVTGDYEKDWSSARNLANDFAIFTSSSLCIIPKDELSIRVPWIATSDAGLSLVLNELCYAVLNLHEGVGNGIPYLRPSGLMSTAIGDFVKSEARALWGEGRITPERENNLKSSAETVLNGGPCPWL